MKKKSKILFQKALYIYLIFMFEVYILENKYYNRHEIFYRKNAKQEKERKENTKIIKT